MRVKNFGMMRVIPVMAVSAAAFLAACSGSNTTPGAVSAPMSATEANAAADVVVNDVGAQMEGATSTSASTSFLASSGGSGISAYVNGTVSEARSAPWWLTGCTPAPTKVVSGTTATYTFTNCTLSRLAPRVEKVVRNGVVAITADTGLRSIVFTNFTRDVTRLSFRTGNIETWSDSRNGTRKYTRTDSTSFAFAVYGATTADPFVSTYTGPDSATGSHSRQWNTSFTADTAGTLLRNQPLPNGVFAVNGNSTWSRTKADSTKTWSLTTTTGTAGVHYSAACDATGLGFDSGTLTTVATDKNGVKTTITITFTACGQYTVAKS
jgi:hypothetical protein